MVSLTPYRGVIIFASKTKKEYSVDKGYNIAPSWSIYQIMMEIDNIKKKKLN